MARAVGNAAVLCRAPDFCVGSGVPVWSRPLRQSALSRPVQRHRARAGRVRCLCDIARQGVTINGKYVNIADIMADFSITTASKLRPLGAPKPAPEPGQPCWDLIELFFFAYRDFVGAPDEVLERLGFGRAHHRVLHFVNRNPGMKVAELLDVLKITKQSLGRVLKQLIDEGYIVQKEGASDRRQRLLYVTAKGETLA